MYYLFDPKQFFAEFLNLISRKRLNAPNIILLCQNKGFWIIENFECFVGSVRWVFEKSSWSVGLWNDVASSRRVVRRKMAADGTLELQEICQETLEKGDLDYSNEQETIHFVSDSQDQGIEDENALDLQQTASEPAHLEGMKD